MVVVVSFVTVEVWVALNDFVGFGFFRSGCVLVVSRRWLLQERELKVRAGKVLTCSRLTPH